MLNSRFGYSVKKNSFKGLNIDCIQNLNIIRITYYSYLYSGTILNPNLNRIRIRPNICARILFVFVFAHSEKNEYYSYSYLVNILIPNNIRIRIRSKKQYSLTSEPSRHVFNVQVQDEGQLRQVNEEICKSETSGLLTSSWVIPAAGEIVRMVINGKKRKCTWDFKCVENIVDITINMLKSGWSDESRGQILLRLFVFSRSTFSYLLAQLDHLCTDLWLLVMIIYIYFKIKRTGTTQSELLHYRKGLDYDWVVFIMFYRYK